MEGENASRPLFFSFMNKKFWITTGVSVAALSLFAAKDMNLAKKLKGISVSLAGLKFKDTVGTPLTPSFRARFYLDINVFNPTSLTVPLKVQDVIVKMAGKPVAALAQNPKTLEITPQGNRFYDLLFSVPVTVGNINQIRNSGNIEVTLKGSIYAVPLTVTQTI